MKSWKLSILAAVLAASFILSACAGGAPGGAESEKLPANAETGAAEPIEIIENVEATGTVNPFQKADLFWKTTGTVEQVDVQEGDLVKAGDLLMSLIATSVPASVLSAEADLINARQSLADLSDNDLATAQAIQALAEAKDQLKDQQEVTDNVGTPARQADLDQAEAVVLLAKIKLDKAKDRYEPWENKAESNPIRAQFFNAVAQAQQEYDSAVRRQNNLLGTISPLTVELEEAKLTLAQANVVQAERDLTDLLAGADPNDVAALQARITAAEATLSSMMLAAPFDSEVLVVNYQPGDVVESGLPAVVLANRQKLHVDTQIDETDIARLLVGDAVEVTLESLPGQALTGKVDYINPLGRNVQGNVKYDVRIELDPIATPVLLGSTADITIKTGEPRQALSVPVRAVQTDDEGEFVQIALPDGTLKRIAITSGQLIGDRVVVLSGDLQAGDAVLLPAASNQMMQNMGRP